MFHQWNASAYHILVPLFAQSWIRLRGKESMQLFRLEILPRFLCTFAGNDGNSYFQNMMRRCNTVSSPLTLAGTGEPINAGAPRPPQDQPNQTQRRPSIGNPNHHQPSNHAGPSRTIMELFEEALHDDEGEGQEAPHASTSVGGNNQGDGPSGSDRERTGSPEHMPLDYEQLPLD